MASVWSVLFFVAAELLLWSGGAKLLRPEPTIQALQVTRLPAGGLPVRLLGAVEVASGLLCLAHPSTASVLLLAILYLGFAGFVLLALAGETRPSSCGCFGASDAPPSWLHVAVDLLAAVAGFVVLTNPPVLLDVARHTSFVGLPFLGGLALAAYLTVLVITTLPALFFSYRGRERT